MYITKGVSGDVASLHLKEMDLKDTLFLRYKPVAYGMKNVFKFPKKGLITSNGLLKNINKQEKFLILNEILNFSCLINL